MNKDIQRVEVEHNPPCKTDPSSHFLTLKCWDADVNIVVIGGRNEVLLSVIDMGSECLSNGELDKNELKTIRDFFITVEPLSVKDIMRAIANKTVKAANESLRRIKEGEL
ncbi:hypothetical protein ACTXGL_01565 [Psychrobacter sp. T6-6]|uniref:hypothetical protein n=1 Tax=Psychrobacter sp. T6-6 TaxID=3457452 RepID=UPI003FD19BA5